MGNIPSTASIEPAHTHTSTPCTETYSETSRHFSVSPFKYSSTFVSITRTSPKTSSHTSSSTIRTEEYCTWDADSETFSCSSWTLTVDTPTPFTLATPTGGYETSEASTTSSLEFPDYTCTDLLCIVSVVSDYGFALCEATSTTDYESPTVTWPWAHSSTTDESSATSASCDLFDWEDCSSTAPEPTLTLTPFLPTDEWPTIIWPTTTETELSPAETSSDCDSEETASTSTDYCDIFDCFTSIDFTVPPEGPPTPYATITKSAYSYRGSSTRRTSTSTTSECDFWDLDCTSDGAGEFTTLAQNPDQGRHHTASTTLHIPRQSDGAAK
ncbi:hypothetical protein GGR51DRAFT_573984 [Nemania sp. FL0031]|nr:hypothetical protein GGR51DRAFT_573984 [Nemania sp. FL0031]